MPAASVFAAVYVPDSAEWNAVVVVVVSVAADV